MNMSILVATAVLAISPATAYAAPPMTAAAYVAKAGASDKFEIESSKLVMTTSDAKLKSFAEMIVSDHTKSTADVVAAAKAEGMTPGMPKLTAKQTSMIADLKKVSGTKRDSLYEKQQVAAHQETLAFQQAYASDGDKPRLKATAAKIVPVVEQHLNEVKSMASM